MQAVIGDDPFDAPLANGMGLLADFLGDDSGGTIWIQEATADDQAHDPVGATVIGLGSWSLEEQALGAMLEKIIQDLVITLAGEIVFLSGLGRAQSFALAFDEHGEATADLVIVGNQEGAASACEAEVLFRESNIHGGRISGEGAFVK